MVDACTYLTEEQEGHVHSIRNLANLLHDPDIRHKYPHEINTLIEEIFEKAQALLNASIVD